MGRHKETVFYCECGNTRTREQRLSGCDRCQELDRRRAPTPPPQVVPYTGPTYLHMADFQQSKSAHRHHQSGVISYGGDVGSDMMKIAEAFGR